VASDISRQQRHARRQGNHHVIRRKRSRRGCRGSSCCEWDSCCFSLLHFCTCQDIYRALERTELSNDLVFAICRDLTPTQRKPGLPTGLQSKSVLKQCLMQPANLATNSFYTKFLESKRDMVVVVSFSEGRVNGLS
jgi:hypothetical protein